MRMPELIMFILYLSFLMGIGLYFYRKTVKVEDYLMGGKKMGKWVTALSAQASDMSGWLLMGLPGAIYLGGFQQIWMALGLFIGTSLNWLYLAPRLRIYTEITSSMTLSHFLHHRFKDPTQLIKLISSAIIIFFFSIYTSSGLVAIGKLFESVFLMDYHYALFIAGIVVLLYTMLGGYLAICWTDFFQGSLMFFAIVYTPIMTLVHLKGFSPVLSAMTAKEMDFGFFPIEGTFFSNLLFVISLMSWGLGYFGQPHILSRFMSIHSVKDIRSSAIIALGWVVISLIGAIVAGMLGMALFSNLQGVESEKVFIYTVRELFNPWVSGILLSAVLSAIMSTIDSQLIVASTSVTEDALSFFLHRGVTEKEKIIVGRLSVLTMASFAILLAWNPNNKILDLVAYAWGGLGAAFGPPILAGLFFPKTSWKGILSGMVSGMIVLILFKQLGFSKYLYELFPGFITNFIVILTVSSLFPEKRSDVLKHHETYLQKMGELLIFRQKSSVKIK